MMDQNLTEQDKKYLSGHQNKAVRYYYYIERGLDVLNLFRNLFLAILAIYVTLKLDNIFWVLAMFVVSIPALVVVGYYNVHRISKMREWLNVRFSTHYGIKSFDYQARQVELLEEISKKLK